jgi:hypothetical protein
LDCCQHPKPIGKIESLDTFKGTTYAEIINSYDLVTTTAIKLKFSVWANEGVGDCDKSGATDVTSAFTTSFADVTNAVYEDNYQATITAFVDAKRDNDALTKSSSAVPYMDISKIVEGRFVIKETEKPKLFSTATDNLGLYFPDGTATDDTGDVGKLKLCTRIEYQHDYKSENGGLSTDAIATDETISFLDTNYIIDIDLTADFSTFTDAQVSIFKRDDTALDTVASVAIDVLAYHCDDANAVLTASTTNGDGTTIQFAAGQDFRICVKQIVDPLITTIVYDVTGFEAITCGNLSEERQLYANGTPDVLTTIDASPKGDSGTPGSIGFTSVVTSALFGSGTETLFKCTGRVTLSVDSGFTAPGARRGLSANVNFSTSTKASNGSNNNGIERKNQEVEEESPFGIAIQLADPPSESSSPSSYGPLLGHYYMAMFGAVIASAAVALL